MAIPVLPTYSAGEILTSADMNDVSTLGNYQGLFHIRTVNLSTTAIDGIFTSDFDNYRIIIRGAYTSGANGLIQLRWRNTSNATVSSTNYQSGTLRYDSSSTAYNYGITGATLGETGLNLSQTQYGSCVMDIYGPRLTEFTTYSLQGAGHITGVSMVTTSGAINLTTNMAGIIFNTTAGSIAGGKVTVYGYRKDL